MRGPEGACALLLAQLTYALPRTLEHAERRHNLPVGALGRPNYVESVPVPPSMWGLDKLPALSATARSATSSSLIHAEPGEHVYEVTYSVRVEVEVAERTAAAADVLRKRWILAVREALLLDLALRCGDASARTGARLMPTPTEDYSPTAEVDRLTVAAALSDWTLILAEKLEREVAGVVTGADVLTESGGWDRADAENPRPAPLHPALAP